MSEPTLHNILVRDFTEEQKKAVESAADKAQKSTSKYIRDAAVEKAGGKAGDGVPKKKPGRKPGTKMPKKVAKVASKPVAAPVSRPVAKKKASIFALPKPFFRRPGRL